MYYYGPEDFAPLLAHNKQFNTSFCFDEPTGKFVYYVDGKMLDLSNENDEKLLALIKRSTTEGKDLVYEAYRDKAFEYDPDCDY